MTRLAARRRTRTRKALRRLWWVTLLALTGCVTEPRPDYCYRYGVSDGGDVWFCAGRATFPADTLPDDLKDKNEPPVVAGTRGLIPCTTDSDCADLNPGTDGSPVSYPNEVTP